MVAALRERGPVRRRALRPRRAALAPQRPPDRAADLAAVVLRHGQAGRARHRGGEGRQPALPPRAAVDATSTSTGSRTSGPGASRASSGGATRSRSGTATSARRPTSASEAPERCGSCGGALRRDPDVLDTWFSSALWPFATLGWPERDAAAARLLPTDVLVTARDIIFLWVARMVMMGVEFTGELPFTDVPITSVIQAPDGRRMSKSLGTGIDPLDEIDAVRRRRRPLRPAGDVLDPGRALLREARRSRGATWPTSSGTPRAS